MSKIWIKPQQVDITQDPGLSPPDIPKDPLVLANSAPSSNSSTIVNNIYITRNGPGGRSGQVQFNEDGSYTGDPGLLYDPNSDTLTTGTLNVNQLNANRANLGSITFLTISGGNNNNVLKTNGSGILSWDSAFPSDGGNSGKFLMTNGISQQWANVSYANLVDIPSNIATQSYVGNAIANLIDSSPAALNTLLELANAIGNDANYSTTITNSLANKASITYVDNTAANITWANLSGKPTIPAAQINSDWTEINTAAKSYIQNKPTLGNISSINISSSSTQVLYGNGVFGYLPAGVNLGNFTINGDNLSSTNNIVNIVNTGNVWGFNSTGNLTLPNKGVIKDQPVPIQTVTIAFRPSFPGSVNQSPISQISSGTTSGTLGAVLLQLVNPTGSWANYNNTLVYIGSNDGTHINLYEGFPGTIYNELEITSGQFDSGTIFILQPQINLVAGDSQWSFSPDGNITLPSNDAQIQYANGTSILSGITGGSTYANSNVANYLPDFTGNITANIITANIHASPTNSNLTLQTHAIYNITTITNGGTTYTSGSGTPTTGGSGVGMTVNVNQSGGVVDLVIVNNPGTGYANGDTITVLGGDGTATFTIANYSATGTDVTKNWIFSKDGNLTAPGNIRMSNIGGIYSSSAGYTVGLKMSNTEPSVKLVANNHEWMFDPNGVLKLPAPFSYSYPAITMAESANLLIQGYKASGFSENGGNVIVSGGSAGDGGNNGNSTVFGQQVTIQTQLSTDLGSPTYNWTFDADGNLSVPGGGSVYSVGAGTAGITANITSGNAYLGLDDTDSTATLFGNAGVQIGTLSGVAWNFSASGDLTLPAAGDILDSTGRSVLGVGGIALTDLSVGADNSASGGGNVSYNSATGVFTYTPPVIPDVSGFALASDIPDVTGFALASDIPDVTGFALASDIPDVTGFVTGTPWTSEGYLTSVPTTLDNSSAGDMDVMIYDGNFKYTSRVTIDASTGHLKTAGDLTVQGDLNVTGTYNTVNQSTLNITAHEIVLNDGTTGTPSFNASLVVDRGSSTNTSIRWNEIGSKWQQTRDGSTYVDIPVNTTELTEGTNLYYTDARANTAFDNRLAVKSTTDLSEGTNQYYTTTRANTAFDNRLTSKSTTDLTEGTNKYFTNARARTAISVTGSGSYDNTTGIITVTGGVTSVNAKTGAVTINTDDVTEGSTNIYFTTARSNTAFDNRLAVKSTTNLTEGTNLYYTDTRANTAFDNRLAVKTTDNVTEGSTNLYFTTARSNTAFDNRLAVKSTTNLTEGTNLYYTDARANTAFDNRLAAKSTSNVAEGTNLYYTTARANSAMAAFTGNLTAGNASLGNLTTSNYFAGVLTTAAQPNITSVGTLTSLTSGTHTVSANANIAMSGSLSQISGGNLVSASYLAGTLTTAAQPNITSTGTLTSLTVTGNITGGNIVSGGVANITGNVTGANLIAGSSGSATGNVYASNIIANNIIINSQLTTYGTVTPAYIVVGQSTDISSVGNGSDFILNTVVGNVNSQVSYNSSTGVYALTSGVTYDMSCSPSWITFSNPTGGFLCYQWVDATTNSPLDSTGTGTGTAISSQDTTAQQDNTTARVIYTPNTNQTVKVRVTSAGGTATLRGAIGTQVVIKPLNPAIAVQAANPVGFRATTPVTNVSVNNGSTVTMLFGTEEVDTNSAYNPATGRFTPNAAGYYSIDWFIVTNANGAGELIASLYKNGVLVAWGTNQTAATAHWNGMGGSAGMIYLNGTTDYISITLTNNSGSTATILAASGLSYFSAHLIR